MFNPQTGQLIELERLFQREVRSLAHLCFDRNNEQPMQCQRGFPGNDTTTHEATLYLTNISLTKRKEQQTVNYTPEHTHTHTKYCSQSSVHQRLPVPFFSIAAKQFVQQPL